MNGCIQQLNRLEGDFLSLKLIAIYKSANVHKNIFSQYLCINMYNIMNKCKHCLLNKWRPTAASDAAVV